MRCNFGKNVWFAFHPHVVGLSGSLGSLLGPIHRRTQRGIRQEQGAVPDVRMAILRVGHVRSVPLQRGRPSRGPSRQGAFLRGQGHSAIVWQAIGGAHSGAGVQIPRGIPTKQRRCHGGGRPREQHWGHRQVDWQQDVPLRHRRPPSVGARHPGRIGAHLLQPGDVREPVAGSHAKRNPHSSPGVDERRTGPVRSTGHGRRELGLHPRCMPDPAVWATRSILRQGGSDFGTGTVGLRRGRLWPAHRVRHPLHDTDFA